jgi:hypothetical protein
MLSDSDRHLLEAYLDDGLSVWEVQRLDTRLGEEAELVAALDQVRAERAHRIAAFNAIAPTVSAADRFAESLIASVHKARRKRRHMRIIRPLAVAAACLMIGFSVGRIAGWGHVDSETNVLEEQSGTLGSSVSTLAAHGHSDAHLVIHAPGPQETGPYQVAVMDEHGKVIAVQKFTRLEDAQEFAREFSQYQARRQQIQQSPMLISDQF